MAGRYRGAVWRGRERQDRPAENRYWFGPAKRGPTHDHPITYETAKDFGLPVRSDIPSEFLDLMNLYPQPVRRQPTVEYLPDYRRYQGADHRE